MNNYQFVPNLIMQIVSHSIDPKRRAALANAIIAEIKSIEAKAEATIEKLVKRCTDLENKIVELTKKEAKTDEEMSQ